MKNIKTFENFNYDNYINEGLVDWIKEKFKKIGQYFNKLKGKALVAIASSILPKEIADYIRKIAGVSISESILILEEFKVVGSVDTLSPEELNSLSDDEYDKYLQKLSDNIVFEFDVEGNLIIEKDKKLHEFLTSRGISIKKEIIIKHQPSLDNIYKKIDKLNISELSKKTLRFASIIFLFGIILFKTTGAHAATIDSNTHDNDHHDGKKDDSKSLWGKLDGKKTTTSTEKNVGPMEEFLNKYEGGVSSGQYFIAKGESKYDLETAEHEARLEIYKHQLEQSGKDQLKISGGLPIVEEQAFKVDGKIIYIIVCKNK